MSLVSNAPWATVDVVQVAAGTDGVWRATGVRHLSPAENAGKHNVFIDCIRDGQLVRDGNLRIVWGWQGQHKDEAAPFAVCNKRPPDHCTDIPINQDQHIWISVADPQGHQSDTVNNLYAVMPSDGPGNDWHHHSYLVTFTFTHDSAQPPVPVAPTTMEQMLVDHERRLKALEAKG